LGYIVPSVQAKVESQQTPQVSPLRARSVPLLTLRGVKPASGRPADADDLKLKVSVEGGDGSAFADMPFVTLVPDKAQSDVFWSVPKGTVEHIVGGVVAENVDAKSIKGVLSKWAALKWLKHQVAVAPVGAAVKSGNQRHDVGEEVEIELKDAKYPHLTLFNLPPDGRVEFFIPDPQRPNEATKDWSRAPIKEQFKVEHPPYGAEHMVAIFSKEPLPDLNAALASMQTPERAQALRPMLEQALQGKEAQFGILDIYTGGGS
jgi:hypothetical protein